MERASGIKRWSRTKAEEQTAALVELKTNCCT